MKTNRMFLATAAAALFAAGSLAAAQDESSAKKVKCDGVNSCKGKSACATASSACSGLNACKGKGYLELTAEECEAAKKKLESEKAAEES